MTPSKAKTLPPRSKVKPADTWNLASLFKSDAYQRGETELVIIITPYFVEPTSGRLRTPLTDRVPPTDADRLVYQRLNHPTPPRRVAVGRGQNVGPAARIKPAAISSVALSRLIRDHLPRGRRGVKRCRKDRSSKDFRIPSIHPQQRATSSASA